MSKQKIDGVIEAVRYFPDGNINLVRIYERRGVVFSDYILMDRERLMEHLKNGNSYYTGRRIKDMANQFDIDHHVKLTKSSEHESIVTDNKQSTCDLLEDVPLF